MIRYSSRSGFTIIELMLAMGGLAFLLIFVVFSIMNTMNLYMKGVATRQINQAGRQVADELSDAVRYGGEVRNLSNSLCVKGYSYLWDGTYDSGAKYSLIRVNDPSAEYCTAAPPTPAEGSAQVLVDNTVVSVLKLEAGSVAADDASPLVLIRVVLATAGDNAPVQDASGDYQCDPNSQYCAFGEFETYVYARNR